MELAAVANAGQINTGAIAVSRAAAQSQHEKTGMQVAAAASNVIPTNNGADDVAKISQEPRRGMGAMSVARISLEA